MSAEEDRSGSSFLVENDSASISAASSVTFHMGSGTDDGTNQYLNLPEGVSYGIEVMPTVACSITEFNGRVMKAAMSVGTLGFRSNNLKVKQLTIKAGTATVVEVSAKGGS